jgi:type I restriction enzyme S subunit
VNSNWKECKLGDVAEITSSKRIYYSEYVANGVPFFRSKEIIERFNKQNTSTELFIKRERYEEIKLKFGVPQAGDILLTSVGTLGVPYLVRNEDEFYFKDGNLTWFRNIDSKAIDRCFIYFWIMSIIGQQKLYEASIGSTQAALTIIGLKNIDILIPPLPEQRAIAGVLSSLDDKVDLLHRQNKTLEGMAEALWRKMFVEEADPGWKKGKLGDEMDIIMGQSPPGNTYNEENQGMLFFQGRAEFGFRFPEARLYCTEPKRFAKRCDTLVSVRAPVGDINMASEECCIGRGVAAVKHKKGFVSYTFYKIRSLKDDFDSFEQQGTVFGSIGKDDFNGIDTFIPDLKIVRQFDAIAKPLDDKIFTNSIQIRTLSRLRDTLLPKLMSGEVRVGIKEGLL